MIEREVFAKNKFLKHLEGVENDQFLNDIDMFREGLGNGRSTKQEALYIDDGVKKLIKKLQAFDAFLNEVASL